LISIYNILIYDFYELLLKLKGMNDEQQKYMLFLVLYKAKDYESRRKIFDYFLDKDLSVVKLYMLALFCSINEYDKFINEMDELKLAEDNYKDILVKLKQLSSELNLKNSLESSNLFTYLLCNGKIMF